jgi:hypothetical protein
MGTGSGLAAVRELLLDRHTLGRGWLDVAAMRRALGRSRSRAERWILGNPQTTWRTVTFELWCRLFLDDEAGLKPPPTARVRAAPRGSVSAAVAHRL